MNFLSLILITLSILSACGQTPEGKLQRNAALAATTGDSEPSLREARFDKYTSRLHQLFGACRTSADVMAIVDKPDLDLRGNAYRLEALMKLYKKSLGDEAKPIYEDLKALEDALGKYGETREATQFAEKVKAPQAVLLALQKRRAAAAQTLLTFLKDQKWIGSQPSKAQQIANSLAKLNWPDRSEDSKFFRERLADKYKELAKIDYPRRRSNNSVAAIHEQLENWTHEMRRDYRWPNIMLAASDGLILRDSRKCSISQYQNLPRTPIAKLAYTQWARNPLIPKPHLIEDCLYLAFAAKIEELGAVKDLAQGAFHLVNGFMDSGIERNPDRAMVLALSYAKIDFDRDIFAKTELIEREVKSLHLSEKMADSLKLLKK